MKRRAVRRRCNDEQNLPVDDKAGESIIIQDAVLPGPKEPAISLTDSPSFIEDVESNDDIPNSDPISSFSDNDSSRMLDDILDGDSWQAPILDESTLYSNDEDDFLGEDMESYSNILEQSPSQSQIISEYTNAPPILDNEASTENTRNQTISRLPSPQFDMPSYDIPTVIARPIYQDTRQSRREKAQPVHLKPDGLAAGVLHTIAKEKQEFKEWERQINARMAKFGSVTRICSPSDDAKLFRMVESWEEYGVVFAWCVAVNDKEKRPHASQSYSQEAKLSQDDIVDDDFVSSVVLLPYEPSDNDEKYLFMFSFVHMNISLSAKTKFLSADCVGIWSPWTTVSLDVNGEQHDAHIATRFMADAIY